MKNSRPVHLFYSLCQGVGTFNSGRPNTVLMPMARAARQALLGFAMASASLTGAQLACAAESTQALAAKQFNIPAGPLDQALPVFARQANITLAIAPGVIQGKTTQGIAGTYSPADGLRALIGSNDLRIVASADGKFWIESDRAGAAATELPAVVVTASAGGVEQQVQDAPASISVITRKELESKPYRDLADALSSVPGVVTTGGGDHKEVNIRGMGSAYTMTLIDGKRIDSRETSRLSDGYGQMNAWTPPVSAIERIEVVRGPMSALYGSDAMGGVINIVTRKVAKEWGGEIGTDATFQENSKSGNVYQGNFFLVGPIKQDLLGLQLYGQYSKRDEDDIYYGYRGSKRGNMTAKLALTPTRDHDIVLEANHTEQRIQQETGKSIDPGCGAYSYPGCALPVDKKVDVDRLSLSHTGRWAFGTSETYVQQEEYDISSQNIHLKNTDLRTSWALPLSNHIVTLGGSLSRNELHDGFSNQVSSLTDIKRTQKSLFAEDAWYLTDTFTLTTGARVDDDDQYGRHWSPRVYGVWNVAPQWTVKGGVTSGFKAPGITQIDKNFGSIGGLGTIYGNPDLKPEKSLNQEIGVLYKQEGLSGSVTLFNNQFKDKITDVACPADQCAQVPNLYGSYPQSYANVGRAITRGLEVTLGLPLARNLTLDNSYTYTYSKQETGQYAGLPLNKLPRHLLASTLNYQPMEALTTWARVTYRGKDSRNVGGAYAILFPVEAPSYTVADLGATYEVNKTVSLRGGIYNLTDKKIGYDRYGFVEDGRRYYLGMTAKF